MLAYVIAAGVLVIAVLSFFAFKRQAPDVSSALRELLLARAEGKLTAEEFEQRQTALHTALLTPADRKPSLHSFALPAIIGVVVIVVAAGLYSWLVPPKQQADDLNLTQGASITALPMPNQLQPAAPTAGGDLSEMAKRLADKLAKDPNNGDGWALLGHSYVELHKHAEAADAFAKAAAILRPDAALLADWADAYVMSHEHKWDKQSRDIVKRALAADPKHLKTLALAGSEAFDRADYKEAIAYWKRMKAAAPADSMDAKLADANMQEATARMGGKPSVSTAADTPAAAGDAFIAGTVTLSAKLKGKIAAGDTVFVVAKTPDGNGPPLAVKRYSVSDLPVTFRLDEAAAIMPGRSLSTVPQALLLARISKSGNANQQPGDIQTTPLLVKVGTSNAKLELGL